MIKEIVTDERWDDHIEKLRLAGEELKANLASRVGYSTLCEAIHACHEIYDLLTAIKDAVPAHAKPDEVEFLTIALDLGLDQVKHAMSHGFEVHGQELDPIKYRLNVAVAIAQYSADRLALNES